MDFLKKWLVKSSVSAMENVSVEAPMKTEGKHRKLSLLDKLEAYSVLVALLDGKSPPPYVDTPSVPSTH